MLEVDQTEEVLGASPCGLLGSDMKTGREQRLVRAVKRIWTIAAPQNSHGESGMKYPPTARISQTCQNPTLEQHGVKTGRYWAQSFCPP